MLYTSIIYAFFLFFVFILYWLVFNRNLKQQNLFLLICSYIFYGLWDWRFLIVLFIISVSNYLIAVLIQKSDFKARKLLFILGLLIDIGTLVIFKYFKFIIDFAMHVISHFGIKANIQSLSIILPIGISFYIFLSLSYIIDVYQHKLKAVGNLFDALLTFSFFPIILAGPIQRPISLLPQIQNIRKFNYEKASDGLRQILWGVFMKIVIADRCALYVNIIFADSSKYSGSTLIFGIIYFTIQIYTDFAGYSNIAIGTGKLLGFNIMQNFAYPYFVRDIKEFWKRWNISLTNWFRDYVFLPIAYSLSRKIKTDKFYLFKSESFIYMVGIAATWILTGLWHGANYTFVVWGLIHGFFLIITHIIARPRKRFLKYLNVRNSNIILIVVDSLTTYIIIMFSWIFFRADNIEHAVSFLSKIFSISLFSIPEMKPKLLFFVVVFFIIEWICRKHEYAIAKMGSRWPRPIRWAMYYSILLTILWFSGKGQQFIYFKF